MHINYRISISIGLFICLSLAADTTNVNLKPALQKSNIGRLASDVAVKNLKTSVLPIEEETARQYNNYNIFGNFGGSNRRRCPLCDQSVFPYCGEKLFHDACCCTDAYQYPLPHKCRVADCGFLHANSCREHRLISNCCCSDEYRSVLRGLGKPDAVAAAISKAVKKN